MQEEFIIEFNEKVITDNYNDSFLNDLFEMLKSFCNAEAISWSFLRRNNDSSCENMSIVPSNEDVYLNIDDGLVKVYLKNIKKEITNKQFFWNYIRSSLTNMVNNYFIIEKLKKEKYLDKMLDVFNRFAYEDKIKENKEYKNIGVAFLDINGLGVMNNMYGYEAGDLMLKTISNCLKENFRYNDIYRIGGDEIVIICDNINRDLFIEKLNKSLELISKTGYTVSLGYDYKEKSTDIKELVKDTSLIMKKNKELYRKMHPEKYINKYTITSIETHKTK